MFRSTAVAAALLVALVGCAESPPPTPEPTPTPRSHTQLEYCGAAVEWCQNITLAPQPTATPPPAVVATPTPTRTPAPTPTPTPTATPPPPAYEQWPRRYEVFADDIRLVRNSEAWAYQESAYLSGEECAKLPASDPRHRDCHSKRWWDGLVNAAALETRYQLLKHQPESEQEKYWPGLCRDIDEQVYIPALYEATQSGVSFNSPIFLSGHWGNLRMLLTTECAEHVPYEPYTEPPDLDCANYDYREDAEEDAYTYWYADDIDDLLDYEYSPTWGTTTELVCGYLPSRP